MDDATYMLDIARFITIRKGLNPDSIKYVYQDESGAVQVEYHDEPVTKGDSEDM